ncbi:hypothetical protein GGD88_003708, partial [Roseospira goensis]|nr:hypothetical protein [Roseospira goensis]
DPGDDPATRASAALDVLLAADPALLESASA